MTYIQKFTLGIIFTILSINMLGCSGGETTVSNGPATIQISPALAFDFGTVTEGNMASPLEVIITNIGSQRLDVSNISISDTVSFQLDTMSGTNTCTFSPALPAGESCNIEVTFTPGQFNPSPTVLATTLTINSNDPSTPNKTLDLTGTSEQVSTVLNALNVTINQVDTATCSDVVAYVSVTDQSNFPVEGLQTADFTITEGVTNLGSPTSADTVDIVTEPISIAIVMDNSSSMQDIDIAEMNEAAIDVVGKLAVDDQAEIIKFDKTVSVVQSFTTDNNLLITAINTPFVGSGTALYEALQQAVLDTESQPTERKAVIIITDGADTSSTTATLTDVINAAQAKGIPIFVIALGNFDQNIIDNVLTPLANDTSGELYEAEVAQNFSTIIEQQLTKVLFVDQYILNYASVSTGGTVDLTIDVSDSSRGLSGTSGIKQIPSCP